MYASAKSQHSRSKAQTLFPFSCVEAGGGDWNRQQILSRVTGSLKPMNHRGLPDLRQGRKVGRKILDVKVLTRFLTAFKIQLVHKFARNANFLFLRVALVFFWPFLPHAIAVFRTVFK